MLGKPTRFGHEDINKIAAKDLISPEGSGRSLTLTLWAVRIKAWPS